MGSHFDDPSQWRNLSPGGTVPIRFLGIDGNFEPENGSVKFTCLVPSDQLITFLRETFPPPTIVGKVSIPNAVGLPGLPGLSAKKITFKHFVEGLPVDPFGFDPDAPDGTYCPVIEVDMEFGPRTKADPSPDNPRAFLEISGNATGEYIQSTASRAKWKTETANPANKPDSEDPGEEIPEGTEVENPDPSGEPNTPGATETQKDPGLPITITVPMVEWSVKWKQVPYFYFYNNLIRRLRWCHGRVNSLPIPLLFGAVPETILFVGFSYSEVFSWKDEEGVIAPPIDVEMKFLEKRSVWNQKIIGHNHYWRPNKGWERLLIDGVNPTHALRDLNVIWSQ